MDWTVREAALQCVGFRAGGARLDMEVRIIVAQPETGFSAVGRNRKVAIITLPGNFNYGNKLQLYACVRIWERLGFEPEFLSAGWYDRRPSPMRNLVRKVLLGREPVVHPEELSSPERLKSFARFNLLIPERRVEVPSRSLADSYCLFSVGSDQVWNVSSLWPMSEGSGLIEQYRCLRRHLAEKRFLDWWFLRMCRPEQRVAMAASIGADEVSIRGAMLLRRGVAGFHRLSVREERGVQILREVTGREAELLCDPTIVLTVDEWRSVADNRYTPATPYVLTYLLGGNSKEAQTVLDCVTRGGMIPTVAISDRMRPGELPVGPAEFLSLIDHAMHVVTDSYHASVFAMHMRVPLTITHRVGSGSAGSMFSRLESLAQTYGLENKIYGSTYFDLARAGDYPDVDAVMESEREKFEGYLLSCMKDAGLDEMVDTYCPMGGLCKSESQA